MRVRDKIVRPGVSIDPSATVTQAARVMEQRNVGSLVIVDGDTPTGIVTDRDLVRRAMAPRLGDDARVDAVMSTPLVTIDADDDLRRAFDLFHASPVRRLVVLEDNRLFGVVAIDDLLMELATQLTAISRPVTAETVFGHRDAPVPATG